MFSDLTYFFVDDSIQNSLRPFPTTQIREQRRRPVFYWPNARKKRESIPILFLLYLISYFPISLHSFFRFLDYFLSNVPNKFEFGGLKIKRKRNCRKGDIRFGNMAQILKVNSKKWINQNFLRFQLILLRFWPLIFGLQLPLFLLLHFPSSTHSQNQFQPSHRQQKWINAQIHPSELIIAQQPQRRSALEPSSNRQLLQPVNKMMRFAFVEGKFGRKKKPRKKGNLRTRTGQTIEEIMENG